MLELESGLRDRGAMGESVVKKLSLVVLSVLLTLLGIEVALRLSRWPDSRDRLDPGIERIVCRYDAALGWRGRPWIHERGRFDDGPYTIDTNSGGWRDFEYDFTAPRGVTRIAVLGDSFTWGFNVRVEKSYPRVLGEMLGPRFQVLSFGLPGYSTDQELLVLRSDALRFHPDVVILGLYLDDIYYNGNNSFRYPKPRFELGLGGSLVLANVPVTDLKSRSRAVEFCKRHLYEVRAGWSGPSTEYRRRGPLNIFSGDRLGEKDWQITKKLLEEIDRECRSRGIRLVVAIIPFDFQVKTNAGDLPQQILTKFGKEAGIPMLDLLPVFLQDEGAAAYFSDEPHWNERGHAAAGRTLAKFLVANNIVRR